MKIAVYTIALNELNNVGPWCASAVDADYRLIVDTGSRDGTRARAELTGAKVAQVSVSPWRFDVARNTALSLLPADIDLAIALDMDERLQPGWRSALDKHFREHPDTTRPRYRYVWSWTEDGNPGLVYGADKIHTRNGYRWRHPVHEVLVPTGITEVQHWVDGLEIHHHPDPDKSRGQYLDLLELALTEDPDDDRNQFYLAREYTYRGQWDKAAVGFLRHLDMPTARWAPERAASMRYLAQGALHFNRTDEAEQWLLRACAEAPGYREPWLDLARLYLTVGLPYEAYGAASRGLGVTERAMDYITEPAAWNGALEEILRACAEMVAGAE